DNLAKVQKDIATEEKKEQSAETMKELKKLKKSLEKCGKYLEDINGTASDLTGRGLKLEKHYDRLKARIDKLADLEKKVKSAQTVVEIVGFVRMIGVGACGVADALVTPDTEACNQAARQAASVAVAGANLIKDAAGTMKDMASA
ncbi:hypothetical protein, partial [Thalassobaculum salexigens]|uniref:hypothetical protein n=1 Tax=Thalassobaculum salexigens TaxID=455360 RepID=UPI00248D818C